MAQVPGPATLLLAVALVPGSLLFTSWTLLSSSPSPAPSSGPVCAACAACQSCPPIEAGLSWGFVALIGFLAFLCGAGFTVLSLAFRGQATSAAAGVFVGSVGGYYAGRVAPAIEEERPTRVLLTKNVSRFSDE